MSLFYYGKDGAMNVIVPLEEIELAAVPLASAQFLPGNSAGRWDKVLHIVSQTIATGGKITITIDAGVGIDRWRGGLDEIPAEYRERVITALRPFTNRFSIDATMLDIEIVCS